MGEIRRLRRLVQLLDLQISALNVAMGFLRQRVMDSHHVGHKLMEDVRNLLRIGNPNCEEISGECEDPKIHEEAEGGSRVWSRLRYVLREGALCMVPTLACARISRKTTRAQRAWRA